jgi:O-antigen ligase
MFASIGVVYSTSRASLAVFILGFALTAVMALIGPERWRSLRQLALAAVIGAIATFFVGGPPFFPHRSSPVAGEQARAAGQSLGQNGGYRLDFWREALTAFRRHPVTGGGYKSLVHESAGHVPSSWPLTPYAHNGYLQPLAEGGLILGIPFLLAAALVAFLCVRILFRGFVRRRAAAESVVVAIALSMVMLHSGVDFDWTYAADFAMFAILAGLVVGFTIRDRDRPHPPRYGRMARFALVGCLLVGVGTLGVSAWVQRDGNHTINLPGAGQLH